MVLSKACPGVKDMSPAEALHALEQQGVLAPRTLTVAITGDCNLGCRHCWVEAGKVSSAGHVPLRTLCRLTEEFLELGGEALRITGGEPLCHPAWLDLLGYARSIGVHDVSLQTNGMLFTDEQVAALRALDFPKLTIQVSLDGATAESHDLVRGAGAFDGVMAGIRALVRGGLGPATTIFFTEMRHNLLEIPELLECAAGLGIGTVTTGALVLCGRAAGEGEIAPPEPDQYLQLLRRYEREPGFRKLYEKIGTVSALVWRFSDSPRTGCCTLVENPYLAAHGRMYPCVLCHADGYAVSGVFDKCLAAVYREGAPLWAALMRTSRCRADAIPECRVCPGRLTCAGGCMGRASGSHGDLLAADDRCEVRRSIYRLR